MTDNTNNPNRFKFTPTILNQGTVTTYQIIDRLPAVNQTATLENFFAGTADNLFQPGSSNPMNGYVGEYPSWYNAATDNYIPGTTPQRQFYQLEPTMVSYDANENIQAQLFYEDLTNNLRFDGGLVNNDSRLFDQEYYSWCPPVNIDKILNYKQYIWLPDGPTAIEIYGHAAVYTADGVTNTYATSRAETNSDLIKVYVDGVSVAFTALSSTSVQLATTPVVDSVVSVYVAVDSQNSIVGQAAFAFDGGITLQTDLRITILNDVDPNLNGNTYIVNGVGRYIQLIPDQSTTQFDGLSPLYITMERGCSNANPWSTYNRWFHISAVTASGISILDVKNSRAQRPIVEYVQNLELYNYGNYRRANVDYVSENAVGFLNLFDGLTASALPIDGVTITTALVEASATGKLRILVINSDSAVVNNKVYAVNVYQGLLQLTVETDGQDNSGSPVLGEIVRVNSGNLYSGAEFYWNGSAWTPAQTFVYGNQNPLFNLYDATKTYLADSGVYPGSNFAGNQIFSFSIDTTNTNPVDAVLDLRLTYDTNGNLQFANYLYATQYTYVLNLLTTDITGYYFYKTTDNLANIQYSNGWYLAEQDSRQYMSDIYTAASTTEIFAVSQEPDSFADLLVYQNNNLLTKNTDYAYYDQQVTIFSLNTGDLIEILTYNTANPPSTATGFYQIPDNLQANPDHEEVDLIAEGGYYAQFSSIISNQVGLTGNAYGINDWKDTAQDRSVGNQILQPSAALLKCMLINSNQNLDFTQAARFVQQQYAKFQSNFLSKLDDYYTNQMFLETDSADTWVNGVLDAINIGKNNTFSFYNNSVGAIPTRTTRNYIPETPSYLGIYPCVQPALIVDSSISSTQQLILRHDGSIVPAFGDFRDGVVLDFETRIYNSIPAKFRAAERTEFDLAKFVSNAFVTNQYSFDEFLTVLEPMFSLWCADYQVDYKTNDTYDPDLPLTWNWSSVLDRAGNTIPGNYRGIYTYYYDTDRPHTAPWEMLGFFSQPDWWANAYGPAPYTSNNVMLWRDLEAGYIRFGTRAGTNSRYARPGLSELIPVDSEGNLLDPFSIGIVANVPVVTARSADWQYGDFSPGETAWRKSFWFPFAHAQAQYLMKPARFVEYNWDTVNWNKILIGTPSEQYINSSYGNRPQCAELYVYGELGADGVTLTSTIGIQQWISEYLINQTLDVADNFGNLVRGLTAQLAYKVGGFTNTDDLIVSSDSFGVLPSENVNLSLYKSPSIREENYSGILIKFTGTSWKVYGYNVVDPYFNTYPVDTASASVGAVSGVARTVIVPEWMPNTYYVKNTTVIYNGLYYMCLQTHTSGTSFESNYWLQVTRPDFSDTASALWYSKYSSTDIVEVPYGTEFFTYQQVATFFNGYQLYLQDRGWVFDSVSIDTSAIQDFLYSFKLYLDWTQQPRSAGDFLTLSPASQNIVYTNDYGNIEQIDQIINGVYSVLDIGGNALLPAALDVSRLGNTITVKPTNQYNDIYCMRIYLTEVEHVINFDNTTVYGDINYDPLLNIRQPRFRLEGYKTQNWTGRINAPGFLVTDNTIIPNFQKTADDLQNLFTVEGIDDSDLRERARANLGYVEKDYLTNLLLTSTNQFEFFQGMIQQKGTGLAMNKLLRSNFIRNNSGIQFLDEWAFRVGDYGAARVQSSLEVEILQQDFTTNPQLIEFESTSQGTWDNFSSLNISNPITKTLVLQGIDTVDIVNPGANYLSLPVVAVTGSGTGAVLTPVLNWSQSSITQVTVVDGGNGFFPGDAVEFSGTGTGATAIIASNGVDWSSSSVASITVLNGGFGFIVGTPIVIVGGNGSATAVVSAVNSSGAITSIEVTTPGLNYTNTATAYVFSDPNATTGVSLSVVVTGGSLILGTNTIVVTNGGLGYDNTTAVDFVSGGSGAITTVEYSGATLGQLLITDPGTGYLSAPTITITGGNPSENAIATCTITPFVTPIKVLLFDSSTIGDIQINSVTVSINTPFTGSSPYFTIGNDTDNSAFYGNISLNTNSLNSYEIVDSTGANISTNYAAVYFNNVAGVGSVTLTVEISPAPGFFASQIQASSDINTVVYQDIFDTDTNEYLYRDPRWVQRYDTITPEWPLVPWSQSKIGNLPNAGYVDINQVDWTAVDFATFSDLYATEKQNNQPTVLTNTLTFSYNDQLAAYTSTLVGIAKNTIGYYRITGISIDVTQAFLTGSAAVSVGTAANPQQFLATNAVNTALTDITTLSPYVFIEQTADVDGGIYVTFSQLNQIQDAPGSLTITLTVEYLTDSILPNQVAWVYNNNLGNWMTYKLTDPKLPILNAYPGSYTGQSTVVAVDGSVSDLKTTDLLILDELSGTEPTLSAVYYPNFSGKIKVYLDGTTALTNIMNTYTNAGLQVNSVIVSVLEAFDGGTSSAVLTVGTDAEPDQFCTSVTSASEFAPSNPTAVEPNFDYGQPIQLDIYDNVVSVAEGSTSVPISVVRSGNVYLTPSQIEVTAPGSGYTSAPNVTVTGPSGVTAVATLSGNVSGGLVVAPGSGYTSTPTVSFIGGGGTGASASVTLLDGGILDFILLSGGENYTSAPTVVVSGGGGSGAQITAVMNYGVGSIAITGTGNCNYTGSPAGQVIISGGGGSGATAILLTDPLTPVVTSFTWQYQEVSPNASAWSAPQGPVTFATPPGTLGGGYTDFWLATLEIPVSTTISQDTVYAVQIINDSTLENAVLGTSTATITVVKTIPDSTSLDLTVLGSTTFAGDMAGGTAIQAALTTNGNTGLVAVTINYTWTTGFEIINTDGSVVVNTATGSGGSLLLWNQTRFPDTSTLLSSNSIPPLGWVDGDIAYVDDGRTVTEKSVVWQPGVDYIYGQLTNYGSQIYQSLIGGYGALASPVISNGNALSSINLTDPGTNYTGSPEVAIAGTGTGASAIALLAPTHVAKIVVLTGGSAFSGDEVLTVVNDQYDTTGFGATARIKTLSGSSILEVEMTNVGQNYTRTPTVVVTSGNTSATFEVILFPTVVANIDLLSAGTNYNTNTTVTIQPVSPNTSQFVYQEWSPASEDLPYWVIEQYSASDNNWSIIAQQSDKIDSTKFTSATIYDTTDGSTQQVLQLYDPYKGIIPGIADREISYKLEYDPAVYTNGNTTYVTVNPNLAWGPTQVGQLWWDISAVRYLDYETGSIEYRSVNWGALLPGTSVNIYEWTRSTIAPGLWNSTVASSNGQPINTDGLIPTGSIPNVNNTGYVETQEWDNTLQRLVTIYYFWVLNPTLLPAVQNRSITAQNVSATITDPTGSGILWWAPIGSGQALIAGAKPFLNDTDSAIKINWNLDNYRGNYHKEWILLRELDEISVVTESLWNKMRDSLVGWDETTTTNTASTTLASNFNPTDTEMVLTDATGFAPTGQVQVDGAFFQYYWIYNNTLHGINTTHTVLLPAGLTVSQTVNNVSAPQVIPAPYLSTNETYGISIRPRQTMFTVDTDAQGNNIPGRTARASFIDELNEIFSTAPFLEGNSVWQNIFDATDPVPTSNEYSFAVDSYTARNLLVTNNQLSPGQLVLLNGNTETYGFWTLQKWQPGQLNADAYGFVVVDAQKYRWQQGEFWTAADWYATGYSSANYPTYAFDTIAARDAAIKSLGVALPNGTLVLINDGGTGNWIWTLYSGSSWSTVAIGAATIELSTQFYESGLPVYGFGSYVLSDIPNRDGSWELQYLLDQLFATDLLTNLQKNQLFFAMVRTAFNQTAPVDWAFKTSFLYLANYSEPLLQNPVATTSQIDNIISYIEDVKPYHVVVRDYVASYSPPMEIADVHATDFDKPPYYDSVLGVYRPLDINNASDLNILKTTAPWSDWYNNYTNPVEAPDQWSATWNGVRSSTITVKYNRISSSPVVGWGSVPWGADQTTWIGDTEYSYQTLADLYRPVTYGIVFNDTTVATLADRSNLIHSGLVRTGTIVEVSADNTTYMWTGTDWAQFYQSGWGAEYFGGIADNILLSGAADQDYADIIPGVAFRGTTLEGANFAPGLWGAFPWGSCGWGNEFNQYVGFDVTVDGRQPDEITANTFEATSDGTPGTGGYDGSEIFITGNDFVQPAWQENNPDELANTRVRGPLTITYYQKPDSDMFGTPDSSHLVTTVPTSLRLIKTSIGNWNVQRVAEQNITLAADLNYNDTVVSINYSGSTLPLHDPLNPTEEFFDIVSLSMANTALTTAEYQALIGEMSTGSVWIDAEKINYRTIEKTGATTYNLIGITRGVIGTSSGVSRNAQTTLYTGDGNTTTFAYNAPVDWVPNSGSIVVKILNFNGTTPITWSEQNQGTEYTIVGDNIVFATAPAASANVLYNNISIEVQVSDWTNSTVTHSAGTSVYDASVLQNAPLNGNIFTNTSALTIIDRRQLWNTFLQQQAGPVRN